MLVVGETDFEPDATGVTEPTPLSIENEVALAVVHERDEESPFEIVVGFAESVQVGAEGGATVTGAEHVELPPGPETVIVYVLPVEVVTDLEPEAIGVTAPTPLSIAALVAPIVTHARVEAPPPYGSDAGFAVSVQVGTGGGGGNAVTVTVAVHVAVPPAPVTVPV